MGKTDLTKAKKIIDGKFADLVDSYRNLREGISVGEFDVKEGGRFRKAAREMSAAVDDLKKGCKAINDIKKINNKKKLDKIEASVEVLDSGESSQGAAIALGGPTSDGRGSHLDEREPALNSFLQNVSLSLIEAQQRLNEQSLDYVERLPRGIPPAYFSIPTLKAELKVGFSKLTGKSQSDPLRQKRRERTIRGKHRYLRTGQRSAPSGRGGSSAPRVFGFGSREIGRPGGRPSAVQGVRQACGRQDNRGALTCSCVPPDIDRGPEELSRP